MCFTGISQILFFVKSGLNEILERADHSGTDLFENEIFRARPGTSRLKIDSEQGPNGTETTSSPWLEELCSCYGTRLRDSHSFLSGRILANTTHIRRAPNTAAAVRKENDSGKDGRPLE